MKPKYEYVFDKDSCLYITTCPVVNDPEHCTQMCPRYRQMDYMLKTSNLPLKLRVPKKLVCGPEDKQAFTRLTEIRLSMVDFVNQGKNVLIHGKTLGNGKTSWAVRLMLNLFNEVVDYNCYRDRALYISVPMFLLTLKSSYGKRDHEFERLKWLIKRVDLIVWDDMAASGMTQNDLNTLLAYIDDRINNGKSNVYTCNLEKNGIYDVLGSRLADRVYQCSEVFELKGRGRRGE